MQSFIPAPNKISRIVEFAKVMNFSKTWVDNTPLGPNQRLLYLVQDTWHLGKLSKGLTGKLPKQAWYDSYGSSTRTADKDIVLKLVFVYDADDKPEILSNPAWDSDGDFRSFINKCHDVNKTKIPFSANVARGESARTFNTKDKKYNSEALVGFIPEIHEKILENLVSQWLGKSSQFEVKQAIDWNYAYKQEEDVSELINIFSNVNLALYAAYTSRGKTLISLATATRLNQNGGIVLITTPITDTLKSFRNTVNRFYLSQNRDQKVTVLDSIGFKKEINDSGIQGIRAKANKGELIIILLSVQDLRYDDADEDSHLTDEIVELRKAYSMLSGNVNLWIRDEFHKEYGGEVTSKRLSMLVAERYLDLTATPYNVLHHYKWDSVLARTLLWGLKYAKLNKLPSIRIHGISEAMIEMSDKFANIYNDVEGYDPRKYVAISNNKFKFAQEWVTLRNRWYLDPQEKNKNPLTISNDDELSYAARQCGMIVCTSGQGDDGAKSYLPKLAELLNSDLNLTDKLYFVDSYTLENWANKSNLTIGDQVESLLEKYGRLVILTCGKFLTGTDIKPLGHIVLMDSMKSISNFEQLLGRMIRQWPGKDEVKLYCLQPNQDLQLLYSEWTKLSSDVSGESDFSYFSALPLTLYDMIGKKAISPTVEEILSTFQEYAKDKANRTLPSQSISRELEKVVLSLSSEIRKSANGFKKDSSSPSITISGSSKAKVGSRTINPRTNKPFTNNEIKDQQLATILLQQAAKYAPIFAVGHNNYDVDYIYRLNEISDLLTSEVISTILNIFEQNNNIKLMAQENLNDKKLAFQNLSFEEVCDYIFVNDNFLQRQNLVFVNEKACEYFCSTLTIPDGFSGSIIIGNALNGSMPEKLKKMYPSAKIYCYEYFNYFEAHLSRLGFQLIDEGDLIMKRFDYGFINPPYMKGKWKTFITELHSRIDNNLVSISPDPTESIGDEAEKWIKKSADMGIQSREDVTNFFPTVKSGKLSLCLYSVSKDHNPKTLIRSNQLEADIINKLKIDNNGRYCTRGGYSFMAEKIPGVKRNKNKDTLPNCSTFTDVFTQPVVVSVGKNKMDLRYFESKAKNSNKITGKGFVINRSFGLKTNDPVYSVNDSENVGFTNNVLWFSAKDDETVDSFKSVFGSKLYRYFFKVTKNGALDIQSRMLMTVRCPELNKIYSDDDLYSLNGITDQTQISYIESNYE